MGLGETEGKDRKFWNAAVYNSLLGGVGEPLM
jgi:hypothetical protein